MTSYDGSMNGPADDLVDLTSGLYRFILAAEPYLLARRRAAEKALGRLVDHAHHLSQRFSEARARATERIGATVEDISGNLKALAAELGSKRFDHHNLRALWQGLGHNYEALAAYLRQIRSPVELDARIGQLKPRNLARNLFHVSTGVLGVVLYEFVLGRTQVLAIGGALLGVFILLDVIRRTSPTWNERLVRRIFAKISRPSEAHRIPSSTWYLAALWLGALLLPQHAIELGTLVLAFGDPVASLAGKRWGKRKLWGDKSLVGTLAFFVAALSAGAVFVPWVVPGVGFSRGVTIAIVVAAAGAIIELVSRRIDDNFTIPLLAGLVAALLL